MEVCLLSRLFAAVETATAAQITQHKADIKQPGEAVESASCTSADSLGNQKPCFPRSVILSTVSSSYGVKDSSGVAPKSVMCFAGGFLTGCWSMTKKAKLEAEADSPGKPDKTE